MEMIKTGYLDVTKDNISKVKNTLFDKIMEHIYPLMEIEFKNKKEELNKFKYALKSSKKQILNSKKYIEEKLKEYKLLQKKKNLVERIDKIVSSGITQTNSYLKKDFIVLLKVINSLDEAKIDYHLNEVTKILSKRMSK